MEQVVFDLARSRQDSRSKWNGIKKGPARTTLRANRTFRGLKPDAIHSVTRCHPYGTTCIELHQHGERGSIDSPNYKLTSPLFGGITPKHEYGTASEPSPHPSAGSAIVQWVPSHHDE